MNTPALEDTSGTVFELREDRAGGTVGLGMQFGSFDTTLGAVYAHGWGKIKTVDMTSDDALAATRHGDAWFPAVATTFDSVMLVFSGAVTTEEAKEQVRKTLPPELSVPRPAPAIMPEPPKIAPAATVPMQPGSHPAPVPAPVPAPPPIAVPGAPPSVPMPDQPASQPAPGPGGAP